jgi:hypothetical protein
VRSEVEALQRSVESVRVVEEGQGGAFAIALLVHVYEDQVAVGGCFVGALAGGSLEAGRHEKRNVLYFAAGLFVERQERLAGDPKSRGNAEYI